MRALLQAVVSCLPSSERGGLHEASLRHDTVLHRNSVRREARRGVRARLIPAGVGFSNKRATLEPG